MKVVFFSAHNFEKQSIEEENKGKYSVTFLPIELDVNTAILAEGAEAISIFVNDDASEQVLLKLHSLGVKLILLRSAGFNHINLNVAKKLNIAVAYVPEYSPYAIAEHTLALMMALNRKLIKANRRVKDSNFNLDGLTGFDFHGKTVGIAGFGKIGKKLTNILLGMGCRVLAFDIIPSKEYEKLGVDFVSFEQLCANSDIISLHLPLNEITHYIINSKTISLMKDGVMLINTGRGLLLETSAVIRALKTEKIGYLGLDVYEEEDNLFFEDHSDDILLDDKIARLMTFPNVLITSHQAFLTKTALKNIAQTTFKNLSYYLNKIEGDNFLVTPDYMKMNAK